MIRASHALQRCKEALRSPFVWAFVGGCVYVTLMRPLLRFEPAPPPVLGRVPEFALEDAAGARFGSADLRGQVWVASFFFTRCESICPAVLRSVAALAERNREAGLDRIRLVTITVDPEHDGPDELRAAAARFGADPRQWVFLTGPAADVRSLCRAGFQLATGEPASDERGVIDIAHSAKLVLVDAEGQIRGHYETSAAGLDEIFHRARRLAPGEAARG